MDRRTYLETKFGGKENAVKVYGQIEDAAKAAGLEIDFAAMKRTPNTIDAHRLIHWSGLEGRQTAVVASLFRAYFAEGKDIGDRGVLLDIAEAAGMDRAITERLFDSEADIDDIRARDAHAREKGVTGVPTFVVANQHALPGAQPPDLWVRVIEDIAKQVAEAPKDVPAT